MLNENVDEKIEISKAELEATRNKIREDEKKLRMSDRDHYTKQIEKEASARAEIEAQLAALKAQVEATKLNAEKVDKEKAEKEKADKEKADKQESKPVEKPEDKPVDKPVVKSDKDGKPANSENTLSLADVERLVNERLQKEMSALRDEAAMRVTMADAAAYREKKIRESGLGDEFADLVSGDTKEDVDKSLAQVVEKAKLIEQRLAERVRQEMGNYVPKGGFTPSADGDGTFGPGLGNMTPKDRQRVARIKDSAEYQKHKDQFFKLANQRLVKQ
jgi:hypothetical protein